jgi:hypothetical protein
MIVASYDLKSRRQTAAISRCGGLGQSRKSGRRNEKRLALPTATNAILLKGLEATPGFEPGVEVLQCGERVSHPA